MCIRDRHYTLYTNKPKQERTLVVTYKQKRIGPALPPENKLIDGGRITSSINRNDVSLPVTIQSISLPAGVVEMCIRDRVRIEPYSSCPVLLQATRTVRIAGGRKRMEYRYLVDPEGFDSNTIIDNE